MPLSEVVAANAWARVSIWMPPGSRYYEQMPLFQQAGQVCARYQVCVSSILTHANITYTPGTIRYYYI